MDLIFKNILLQLILYCSAKDIRQIPPIVQTTHGSVKGIFGKSRNGASFYAFKGIPYAKPPVGPLRFKAPEDADKWHGILNADKDPPYCAQKNYLFANPHFEGSEDCLYLNIYTPQIQNNGNAKLPVMVFIHWGGFFAGYGTSDYLGPQYFMDTDIVLVTFNYRLGVLGFLSTADDAAPGNYGLKDQVQALKWIRNNIGNFGGNKDKVTIFGQSAGGASVHYHMLSPSSKGLFQQGISQSGSALALWAKPFGTEQLIIAKYQAQFLNCNTTNSSVIVECLRKTSVSDLINSGDKFKYFSVDPLSVFVPSIEKETIANPNPFITKQPVDYIRNNETNLVPWIIGLVEDEGLIRAEPISRQSKTRNALNSNFDNIMPHLMGLQISTPKNYIFDVWRKIKDFYFLGKNSIDVNNKDSVEALINVYTDRSFSYSSFQTALFHNLKGHNSIWFYLFRYEGQYSYGNIFAATNETLPFNWGVSHCDDLLYLFKTPSLFPDLQNTEDLKVSDFMIKTWTNFAIKGDPSPDHIKWTKLDNKGHQVFSKKISYLNIQGTYKIKDSLTISMMQGIYKNRFKFWEDIPLVENIPELNQSHVDMYF